MNSLHNARPVAVITGGGTGLGLATALELKARGYEVLALGLDVEPELHGSGIEFEQLACQLFHRAPAARRGNIVNFASMWSYFGSGRNPGYCASKGDVMSLTRALAVGFAQDGVRVNAVAPGWIETRMSASAFNDPERRRAICQRIPAGCWGKPADIAKAVAFLASADARYITGVTLPVDGGYSVA